MQDTLKTACVGMSGSCVAFLEWFPQLVSLLVGVVTLIYMSVKLYKELK